VIGHHKTMDPPQHPTAQWFTPGRQLRNCRRPERSSQPGPVDVGRRATCRRSNHVAHPLLLQNLPTDSTETAHQTKRQHDSNHPLSRYGPKNQNYLSRPHNKSDE